MSERTSGGHLGRLGLEHASQKKKKNCHGKLETQSKLKLPDCLHRFSMIDLDNSVKPRNLYTTFVRARTKQSCYNWHQISCCPFNGISQTDLIGFEIRSTEHVKQHLAHSRHSNVSLLTSKGTHTGRCSSHTHRKQAQI